MSDNYQFEFVKIDGALKEALDERCMWYREPLSHNNDTLKSNMKQSNSLLLDDVDFLL